MERRECAEEITYKGRVYWWKREIFSGQSTPCPIIMADWFFWGEGSWKVELLFIFVSRRPLKIHYTVNTQRSLLPRWMEQRAAIHKLCSLILRWSAQSVWFCQLICKCLFNLCAVFCLCKSLLWIGSQVSDLQTKKEMKCMTKNSTCWATFN